MNNNLQSKLRIIESLVVLLPFCIFFYLFYNDGLTLNKPQKIILIFLFILVLAGLIILRKIFEKFFKLTELAQKVDNQVNHLMTIHKEADELERVSSSFSNLLKRFEDTTSELQRRGFELFTIKELVEVAVHCVDGDELLILLLEKALAVTSAEIGYVYVVEHEKKYLRLVASRGFENDDKNSIFIEINETESNGTFIGKRGSSAHEDIEKKLTDLLKQRHFNDSQIKSPSFLCMVIYGKENILGVLNLAYKDTSKIFNANDKQILLILITEMSFALEAVLLRTKMQRNLKDLQEKTSELSIANEKFQREIAERKATENKLSETTYFLKNILDSSSSISIISTDLAGNILFWNTGAEKIFGYKAEEVLGKKNIGILYPNGTTESEIKNIKALTTKGEKIINKEVREITKNGQILWISLNLTPMFDDTGQVIGILGIGADVTKRKQAEMEKEEINKQLIQAQKMELIGQFAGGLAHDSNNLLSVIHGYAKMLQSSINLEDSRYQYTVNIIDAIEKTSLLFKKLLTFSRNKPLQLSIVNINTLIQNMKNMFDCFIGEGIQLVFSLDPEIHPVKIDQGQIEQVLMNLAVNARDAMPDGGTLTIKTEKIFCDEGFVKKPPTAQPGPFVRISVEDSGIGMNEETMKHVFEPLFSTKKATEGTGLGLFIVYGIVKQHEGWVNIESKPGIGSTFRVYLPAFI